MNFEERLTEEEIASILSQYPAGPYKDRIRSALAFAGVSHRTHMLVVDYWAELCRNAFWSGFMAHLDQEQDLFRWKFSPYTGRDISQEKMAWLEYCQIPNETKATCCCHSQTGSCLPCPVHGVETK